MDSARKPLFSRLLLLTLGLLASVAVTGCNFYTKKKDGEPQSQSETKKDAGEGSDAEAGLEEGVPPAPEPPSAGAPSATAPSGEGAQPGPSAPSSGSPSVGGELPPPASSGESTTPGEGSGQSATPPKPAPENP